MAQFRAVIQGARGEASRLGSKVSGLHASIQSWSGQVNVAMWYGKGPERLIGIAHEHQQDQDWVRVSLTPHDHQSQGVTLFEGPCDSWAFLRERDSMAMRAVHEANKPLVTTGVDTDDKLA